MSKFSDEVYIKVMSGKGGNGCVAFRREKYVPLGGPAGGDGGRGGHVYFEVKHNLRTLSHLRHKSLLKAGNGRDGEGAQRHGLNGEDLIIPVPPGSLIKNADSGELLKDFTEKTEKFLFLKGGNGGWGNVHFKSSVNQAPRKALPGQPGQLRWLKIELRIIADIGFVGLPNAGKSSLLAACTNARPKIAAYPFTTKIPNLGLLRMDDRDIVLADIPGLIEGASEGVGLGLQFLKHLSRVSALAFLVDLSDEGYLEAVDTLQQELAAYSPELARKRRILIGTKLDLAGTSSRLSELRQRYASDQIYGISVFSGEGLDQLIRVFSNFVVQTAKTEGA